MAGVGNSLMWQITSRLQHLPIPNALFTLRIIHHHHSVHTPHHTSPPLCSHSASYITTTLFTLRIIHHHHSVHTPHHTSPPLCSHSASYITTTLFTLRIIHHHHSVHTPHHTSSPLCSHSASYITTTLWERPGHFSCSETSRFCCELYSGSCAKVPSFSRGKWM